MGMLLRAQMGCACVDLPVSATPSVTGLRSAGAARFFEVSVSIDDGISESSFGASANDIDRLTQKGCWQKPERIKLPSSGIEVMVCRPTSAFFRQLGSQWPAELLWKFAVQVHSGERAEFTPEEISFIDNEVGRIMRESFYQASRSISPRPIGGGPIILNSIDGEFARSFIFGPGSEIENHQERESQPPDSEDGAKGIVN